MNIIAHRGLHSKNTKENTLLALILGDRHNKIDGIEFDVRLTKDYQVVVIHDDSIDRTSNGKGRVSEMTLDRLKRFNYGTFFKRSTISALDEVLSKLSSNNLIVIELKDELDRNDILASRVLEIIKEYPNLNIWLKSFSLHIINYLKRYSNYPVGILIDKNEEYKFDIDVDFYSINQNVVDKSFVLNKLNHNNPVMIWTVNSNEKINILQNKLGTLIDKIYIISDNPLNIKK